MFQHKEELKRSFVLTAKNRILWLFGLFLAEGYVFTNVRISDARRAAIEKFLGPNFWKNLTEFFNDASLLIVKKFWLIGLILLVLFVLSIISRGALLTSLRTIRDSSKAGFKKEIKAGLKSFWRLLGLSVLLWLGNLPAIVLWYFGLARMSGLLVGIGLALFFIYNILVLLFKHYAYCFAVYEGAEIFEGIAAGWQMFVKNWKDSVLAQLARLLATAIASVGLLLAAVIVSITFFVVGMIVAAFAGKIGFSIVVGVGAVVFFGVLFWFNALLNVYIYSYLTKLYWWLRNN
ncbi:hypothetical protein HY932_02615 [Candidatus Falkowbacteria bacterium]|nr:hypothetical protein [Candidatus Falkowbacteria bacterium]